MDLPEAPSEQGMTRTYVLVIVCHAAMITLLWLFGHIFSH